LHEAAMMNWMALMRLSKETNGCALIQ
jgi:hypothetical protein